MKYNIKSQNTGVSTLLVSSFIYKRFEACRHKFGGTQTFFQYLVRRVDPRCIVRHNSLKTKYQSQAKLIKINFRPKAEDWELLRNIAASRKISMTYLFVQLLERYFAGDSEGVPSDNISSSLAIDLIITPQYKTLTINHRISRKKPPS